MKKPCFSSRFIIALAIGLIFINESTQLYAQLDLRPPASTSALPGATVTIPLILTNPSAASIDAFGVKLFFPNTLLDFSSVQNAGTLTAGWIAVDGNPTGPNEITIGGFNLTPTTSSGVLVNVAFQVKAGISGSGALQLGSFVDDLAGATTADGIFEVIPLAPPDLSPPASVSAPPGVTVTIPLNLINSSAAPIDAFGLKLFFPSTLLSFSSVQNAGTLTAGWIAVDGTPTGPNEITIGGFNLVPTTGSGVLVNVVFEVRPGVTGCGPIQLGTFVDDLVGTTTTNGEFCVQALPDIAVNPTSHNYGNVPVGSSASRTFVVSNEATATVNLEVIATTLMGANPDQFSIVSGGAPFTLAPGASRNLLVSFNPSSTGAKTAVLRIVSNDPDESTVNVVLSGTGVVDTCSVAITSPADGAFICDKSVVVTGSFEISAGKVPICTINGDTANVSGNSFSGTATLTPGFNNLIATCTFVDGLGHRTACSDTVVVFSDRTPAECTFDFSNSDNITGVAIDDESGIATIEPFNVKNRIVTIEPFNAGDKLVRFNSVKIDPNERSGFMLRITNLAGCVIEFDPVLLRLDPTQSPAFTFTVPHTDRYLYVNNHGLRRIAVTLNQHAFELVADQHQREVEGRTYVMPSHGARTIDLAAFMTVGENNVTLTCEGPPNSGADVILADVKIDERSGIGETVPQDFALLQNYPNPFNPSTTIRFSIPERMTNGVPVQLRIYNTLGNLVRSLVDETMFPGQHAVEWDGRNAHGDDAASGIYIYQLVAGQYRITKRMMRLK